MYTKPITDPHYIFALGNENFRQSEEIENPTYIHDTQINAAKNLVFSLNEQNTRRNHVMLIAKMQSGKTGVCNATVNIMEKTKINIKMGVKRYFFITGMNDCGLKNQTYERVLEQVINAKEDNVYKNRWSRKNKNRFFVLKNSDLMAYKGRLNNAIIFIDECHYGSNESNVLTKFFKKHGIDWKNRNDLIARNIYIVSVSATPFDELISDRANCKKMVTLKTNSEYVGVSDYLNKGLICDGNFTDKCGEVIEKVIQAKRKMDSDNVSGIIFIRTRNFEEFKVDEYISTHFDIFEMFANGTKIEYDKFNAIVEDLVYKNENNIKTKPLIILIKGAFRAGITLKETFKNYIYMVYDYSKKSSSTAQALLGRMCGYRSSVKELKTMFYINQTMASQYSKWEGDFTNKENIPCDGFAYQWLPNDSEEVEGSDYGSKTCGNFTIDMTDDEIRSLYLNARGKKVRAKYMEQFIPKFFAAKGVTIPYDYIMESAISGKNNYKKSSQVKRFDSFSPTSLVYQFRPEKIKKFIADTGRIELTHEDVGKKCISVVLDAEIYNDGKTIGGNKRLLVYYVEVGQRIIVPNKSMMYKEHKDTTLLD